jgi:hypothetical protein
LPRQNGRVAQDLAEDQAAFDQGRRHVGEGLEIGSWRGG